MDDLDIILVIWINFSYSFLFDAIISENDSESRHLKRIATWLYFLSITTLIGIGIIFLPNLKNLGMVFEFERGFATTCVFWGINGATYLLFDGSPEGSMVLRFFVLLAIKIGFIKEILLYNNDNHFSHVIYLGNKIFVSLYTNIIYFVGVVFVGGVIVGGVIFLFLLIKEARNKNLSKVNLDKKV